MLDFPKRAVREPIPDEKFRYGFEIAPELVRTVLRDDEPDWVNTIFLSTRFKAWRVGGYNEYLYTFFKCLTDERIAYADGWFAEAHDDSASITLDGWEIQRRCPHLKADLSKFGVVDGTTLTCNLHGWQWNLTNGRCLTSKGHELRSAKAYERRTRQYYDDGLIQLDRHAITLRRYHFPSGTSKVIPLRSIRGYKAEPLGLLTQAVPHLGQLGPAPLAAAGRLAADQVDAGDARRPRHQAAARRSPRCGRRSSSPCSTSCSSRPTSASRSYGRPRALARTPTGRACFARTGRRRQAGRLTQRADHDRPRDDADAGQRRPGRVLPAPPVAVAGAGVHRRRTRRGHPGVRSSCRVQPADRSFRRS